MSDSNTDRQPLFEEFGPVSKEEWEEVIKKDLKGADYKQKLRWETGEGVTVLPFYRREDMADVDRESPLPKNYKGEEANSWGIREPIFESSVEDANNAANEALEKGADALQFPLTIRRAEGMLGGDLEGVPVQKQEDFSELLQAIPLEKVPLHFDSGLASPALLGMLWNESQIQNADPKKIEGTFSYDPFVFILQNGHFPKELEELKEDIIQLAQFSIYNLPAVRPLGIDARTYHNMGATIVQELGYAMAAASEYLSILTDYGFDTEKAASSLNFSFSVGSSYFPEIAKFRAARLLWKNLLKAYEGDPESSNAYLHGETSQWNKTLYDPYTNMLRTSTEGMSAAVAGCDSITVLPFDQHFRQPDDFSQRIARNQQVILSEEAYLDKVGDPSAGSYYIEKLTDRIGEKAWELFREVEAEGGLFKAIENGTVQSALEESQQKRDQAVASRGRVFVGTNQYSNPEDQMSEKMDSKYRTVSLNESEDGPELEIQNLPKDLAEAFSEGALLGDIAPFLFDHGRHYIRTVGTYRGTQAFEELRLATERHHKTPKVLTLPLGNRKMRKARSTFSSNFFGCAGYAIENPIGYEDVDSAVASVREEEADIAVICSSDEEYRQLVPAICSAVEELDDRPIVVLAGYPEEDIETYKEAGVDEFIYAKCNVLETLKRFQKKLGIIE